MTQSLLRALFVAALVVTLASAGVAVAQSASPFGVGRPDGAGGAPASDLAAWIIAQQSAFYRALSAEIRAYRSDSTAALGLVGLSLAYGVFHAAGPGHGKAVISSYLLATGDTLRRAIGLSFAAAFLQSIVAIGLVSILALVLNATASQMDNMAFALERLSYGVIAAVGLFLVWRKGTDSWAVLARRFGWPGATLGHSHGADGHGHRIAPEPREIAKPLDWRSAASVILSIGIRPCTGAIIVLVFALAQGVMAIGIASAFAMAIGTAVTVSFIASVAVLAKGIAVRLAAPGSFTAGFTLSLLELGAALFILLLGIALFVGAQPTGG